MLAREPDLVRDIVPLLEDVTEEPIDFSALKWPRCKYHAHAKVDVCPWAQYSQHDERDCSNED